MRLCDAKLTLDDVYEASCLNGATQLAEVAAVNGERNGALSVLPQAGCLGLELLRNVVADDWVPPRICRGARVQTCRMSRAKRCGGLYASGRQRVHRARRAAVASTTSSASPAAEEEFPKRKTDKPHGTDEAL